jgi:hypothetical protein
MTSTALHGAYSAYALLAANLAVTPTTIADDDTYGGTTSQSIPVDSSYGLNRAPRDDTAIAAGQTLEDAALRFLGDVDDEELGSHDLKGQNCDPTIDEQTVARRFIAAGLDVVRVVRV